MTAFKIPDPPYSIEGIMEDLAGQFGLSPRSSNGASQSTAPSESASHPQVTTGDATRDQLEKLEIAEHAKYIEPAYQIRSHRALLRYFLDPIKKIAHWATRPYIALLIEKQQWYNHLMVQLQRSVVLSIQDSNQKMERFITKQETVNQGFLEAIQSLGNQMEFLGNQAESFGNQVKSLGTRVESLGSQMENFIELQKETNRVFHEALVRADASAENQTRINEIFERARQKTEPFIEHQEKTNEIFRETLRRFDDSIENQAHINAVFESVREKTEPFIEHQTKTNEIFREALGRSDASIENQARINGVFESVREKIEPFIEHQEKTNEIFREALHRADTTVENQAGINQAFESARRKIEPFIEHQEKTNEIFREALHRSDESIANQSRVNQLFQGTHEKIEPFIQHQEKTNETFRETLLRLEAFIDANGKLPEHVRSLQDRYNLEQFYDHLPEGKRRELVDRFRGTFEDIWGRHHIYLEYLRNRPGQILDIGCGRGEFLSMLRYEGIQSWGCEVDSVMATMAREKELYVRELDALGALKVSPPASLGGVFSSQVIEHLFPGEVLSFLKLSYDAIAPGGVLIIETLNPQSLGVLAKSYYRDLDHKQPIDPDYLSKLVQLAGFENVEVHRIREFGAQERLPELPDAQRLGVTLEAHRALKKIVDKLNATIWGSQDYFVIGEIPVSAGAPDAPDAQAVTTASGDVSG